MAQQWYQQLSCVCIQQVSRVSKRDFNAACWDKLRQLHMLLYLSMLWSIFFLYNRHISYITVLSPLSSRNLFTSITQLFLAPFFLTVFHHFALIAVTKAQLLQNSITYRRSTEQNTLAIVCVTPPNIGPTPTSYILMNILNASTMLLPLICSMAQRHFSWDKWTTDGNMNVACVWSTTSPNIIPWLCL